MIPFQVEEGTGLAQWYLAMPGTTSEDRVHAYLYDCTSGYCLMRDANVPAAATYLASVDRPAAGRWLLAVTPGPRSVSSRRFTVNFSQALTQEINRAFDGAPLIRITSGAPSVQGFLDPCAARNRDVSLILRAMPLRPANSANTQPDAGRPGEIVPTLTPLTLCRASASETGGTHPSAHLRRPHSSSHGEAASRRSRGGRAGLSRARSSIQRFRHGRCASRASNLVSCACRPHGGPAWPKLSPS